MAILSGIEILKEMENGRIKIEPFSEKQLNTNSYNLRLSNKLLIYTLVQPDWHISYLDARQPNPTKEILIPSDGLILYPDVLYLGSTVEYTETDGFVPVIEGRSSIGRLGITTHITAGFGDAAFKGTWTLELTVVHPVKIYPEMEICQIVYTEIKGDYRPYNGKYQHQRDPCSSRMWQELEQ